MKTASQVIGMPLMGIKEGKECGSVKDFVIDPQTKKVCSIILKWENSEYDFRELMTNLVLGIGKDYVITQSLVNAGDIKSNGTEMMLLGMKCISCTGNILGNIKDFVFEESTGEIKTVRLDNGTEINNNNIISISNNLMFVNLEGNKVKEVTSELTAYEKEQRDYLLGRVVNADIITENGTIIVKKGAQVTEEIIRLAEDAGLIIDLTLNLERKAL